MKWWITGAKGLVGKALFQRLGTVGVGTGKEIDISNRKMVEEFLRSKGPFDGIINCAAFSKVDLAESHKEAAFQANALGPEVLGTVARKKGLAILHLSTDYVFSGQIERPMRENDPTNPCNYYGITKLEGETRLMQAHPEACILRTSWIFGSGGSNFASLAIGKLLTEKKLRLVSDQISRPTYVEDLVSVICQIKECAGLYQFANQGEASKFVFAQALKEELLKRGSLVMCEEIEPCLGSEFPAPAKRPLYTPFDTTKIEMKMNIHLRPWKEALVEFVEQYTSRDSKIGF